MTIDILSFGNASMLETVLNGVAMLTTTGNEFNVYGLARLGFMIGLITIGIGAVVTQKLEPQKLFFGFLMFYFMFVPKETVTVEDVYSGDTVVVANVPIGVAYPMYAITSTGRWLTEAFETVYSIPEGKFKQGYMNALHVLVNTQKLVTGPAHLAVERSVSSYIQQCVNYALFDEYLDESFRPTIQSINATVPMLDGLRTGYINRDVLTYITSAGLGSTLVQLNCADAYEAISSYMSVDFGSEWLAGAGRAVLKYGKSTRDPVDEVQKAASALGIEIRDSYSYMTTALIRNAVKCQTLGECAMLTQKIEQRNVEWGADKALFLEVARPIMSFIEILVCAVTPLLAFLLGLGPQGVSMGMKYFLMLIWIALWQPLLAICNMYIHIAASQDVAIFKSSGVDFDSSFGMGNVWESLQSWIATGNMMASAVPALALMLVYGGSVAATSLSGRMNGGHVDARSMRPDLIGASPMMSHGGALKIGANEAQNAQGGVHAGGAGSPFSVSADSSSMQSMVSSRSAAFEQSKAAESRADTNYGQAWEKAARKTVDDQLSKSSFAGTSASQTAETSFGESLAKRNGWSNQQTAAWNVGFGAAADAVGSGKMSAGTAAGMLSNLMKHVGADVSARGSGADASTVQQALAQDLSTAASKRTANGADSGTRVASTHSDAINQSASSSAGVRQGQSYAQAKSNRESAGASYNEAVAAQAKIGSGFQMSADTLAGVLQNDKSLAGAVAAQTGPAFFSPQQLQQYSNRLAAQGNFFHKGADGSPDSNMVRAYAMVASGRGGELAAMVAGHGYMPDGSVGGVGVKSAGENKGLTAASVGLSPEEKGRAQAAGSRGPDVANASESVVPKATAPLGRMIGVGSAPTTGSGSPQSSQAQNPGNDVFGHSSPTSGAPASDATPSTTTSGAPVAGSGPAPSAAPGISSASPAPARSAGGRKTTASAASGHPQSVPTSGSAPSVPGTPSTGSAPGSGVASGLAPAVRQIAQNNAAGLQTPNGAAPGRLSEDQIAGVTGPGSQPSESVKKAGEAASKAPTLGNAGGQAMKAWNGTWDSLDDNEKTAVKTAAVAFAAAKGIPAVVALGKNGAEMAKTMRTAMSNPAVRQAFQNAFQARAGSMGSMNAIPGGRPAVVALAAAAAAPVLVQAMSRVMSGQPAEAPSQEPSAPKEASFPGSKAHLIPR